MTEIFEIYKTLLAPYSSRIHTLRYIPQANNIFCISEKGGPTHCLLSFLFFVVSR